MTYILGLLVGLPVCVLCATCAFVVTRPNRKPQEPALTPRDLEVLRESAEELVQSITSAADESLRKLDEQRAALEDLVLRAEKAAESLKAHIGPSFHASEIVTDELHEAVRLSREGLDTTDIAKRLNIGSGEVELLLNLRPKAA